MLNDAGKFIDDCVVYRMGPHSFMVVHGSGQGHEQLTMAATGRNVAVMFDDDLHDISLLGPPAVDYLARHVPGIRDVIYFSHIHTTLFGRPVTISRTGYTGERGYGHHPQPVHHAGPVAGRKLSAVLSLRQFRKIPVRG